MKVICFFSHFTFLQTPRLLGLYDECQQFKYFMEDINSEIQQELDNLKEIGQNGEEEDAEDDVNGDDRKKLKLMSKSSRMLKYLMRNNLEATFSNITTALRIFETIAICNASGERSFSKLKRVKGPLRSTQTQELLNDYSMLYMNNDILKILDCDQLIKSFAMAKVRRKTIKLN